MTNVTDLKLVECGEGHRFSNAEIIDGAKGEDFESMAILGIYESGEIWVSGTANAGETLILLERVKHFLVFGDDA